MNYCQIKNNDVADGLGVRVSLFVSGCRNCCEGCFQPETWDFNYGEPFDASVERKIMGMLSPYWIAGLTLLGGDPMEPENEDGLMPFLKRVKEELPTKDIWAYTGYLYEDIADHSILQYIDVLVDGRFELENKSPALAFRGSSNQRIIDVKRTKEAGHIVLLDIEE